VSFSSSESDISSVEGMGVESFEVRFGSGGGSTHTENWISRLLELLWV